MEWVFSYHVSPRGETSVVKLHGKPLYQPRHFVSTIFFIIINSVEINFYSLTFKIEVFYIYVFVLSSMMLHIIIMCYPICFALLIHSIPANLSIRKTVAWWSNQNKNKNNSSLTQKLTFMVHFMTQRKSVFYVFFFTLLFLSTCPHQWHHCFHRNKCTSKESFTYKRVCDSYQGNRLRGNEDKGKPNKTNGRTQIYTQVNMNLI